MLSSFFTSTFDGMRNENKFMRIALLGVTILLFVQHCNSTQREEIITVVPPTMVESGWLSRSSSSSEYTDSWAMYLAMMLGNVNPANGTVVKETVGALLAPDIYQEVMSAMDNQIHQIRQDRVSLRFEPDKILRDADNPDRIYVTGRSVSEGVSGDKVRTSRTYEIDITIKNYKPQVHWLSTYAGAPRTAEVIAREKAIQERQKNLEKK